MTESDKYEQCSKNIINKKQFSLGEIGLSKKKNRSL